MLNIKNTTDGYLKDVEIKGNTIQDAENLADIRSVGDKVEGQELYEIPVVSCGKNLVDNSKHYIVDMKHPTQKYVMINNDYSSADAICYLKQGTYSFSVEDFNLATVADSALFIWKKDKIHSNARRVPVSMPFTIEDDEIGITFYISTSTTQEATSLLNKSFMIEKSTQATPYEPYQEDKLTILSPVQIEKVGDVRDRIICKDGVWGVEKNIGTVVCDASSPIANWIAPTGDFVGFIINSKQIPEGRGVVICNKFNSIDKYYNDENIYYAYSEFYICLSRSKLNTEDIVGFKEWLNSNNLIIKIPSNNTQFIPLPHDQQVKLRTFAGQTNIHFETEIEGTIKAQVPKSLGATVNTHTEQISNLNKELDMVKKLEESTVSTVTTESDFTTVEETSNGYFEDVKLEGKTLVNLCKGNVTIHPANNRLTQDTSRVVNDFTIINASNKVIAITIYKSEVFNRSMFFNSNTVTYVKLSSDERIGVVSYLYENGWTSESIDDAKINTIILEGDHTQNPPEYFEGLMSVGEDVEEVSVESVNENLYTISLLESVPNWDSTVYSYGYSLKHLVVGEEYIVTSKNNRWFKISTSPDGHNIIQVSDGNTCKFTMTEQMKDLYLFVNYVGYTLITNLGELSDVCLIKYKEGIATVPQKQDKKPLLYYNNETQTWEKPILRQWDSIEKHSDGKYYYHKRSEQLKIDEDCVISKGYNNNLPSVISFDVAVPNIEPTQTYNRNYMICDRFSYEIGDILYNTDKECIAVWNAPKVRINILQSKLSTQDVAGFKAWLQDNPTTVVYQLAQEEVYECTNIDLITYANETNYVVNSGAIIPRTTLKVMSNISNTVRELQRKVSTLESYIQYVMIDALNNALNE